MVVSCCAYGCTERAVKGGPVTFHCFPTEEQRKKIWETKIRRENFKASKSSRLCSKHFAPDCFDREKFGGTWLKKTAVPTIFDFPKHLIEKKITRNPLVRKIPESEPVVEQDKMPCCCVPFCKSNKDKDKISFHEFPADLELRFAWLRAIRRRGDKPGTYWQPTDRSVVCQKHFATSDFNINTKIRRLLPNAVPSIFPGYPTNKFPETHQKRKLHTPETPRKKICVKEENNDILSSMSTCSETDTVSLQQSDENFKTSAIVCDVNQSNECNSHELNSEIFQPSRHVNNPETKTNSSKLYKRLETLEKENSKLRNVVKFLSNELLVAKSHKKKESLEEKQLKKIMHESAKNKLPAIMLLEQIRSFGERKINV